MKKILTLLVMFLATANILMAQTTATAPMPKLTYQIVVRDIDNNLVVNQLLQATVTIQHKTETTGADYVNTQYLNRTVEGTTNMNGMLVLVLEDEMIPDVLEGEPNTLFQTINWADARIIVNIDGDNQNLSNNVNVNGNPEININKELPVYAVPYAMNSVVKDLSLTTPEIVKYLVNVPVEGADVEEIFDAFWGNPNNIGDYLHDTIYNWLKTKVGSARALTLYFLERFDEDDVQALYDAVPDSMKKAICQKVADKVKNHKDAALEVAVYYLENVNESTIQSILDELIANENAKTIMAAIVDSVKAYVINHDQEMVGYAKQIVDAIDITESQMNQAWQALEDNEHGLFDAVKSILNQELYAYLDTVYYAVSDSNCHPVNICELRDQIAISREHAHINCPELTQVKLDNNVEQITLTSTTTSFTMKAGFVSNPSNVDLTGGEYKFIVKFPNTNYAPVTFNGTYDDAEHVYSYVVSGSDLDMFMGRTAEITTQVTGLRCKALSIENNTPAYVYSETPECPQFASFTHTGNGAEELNANQGIKLTAKLYSNYDNITDHGFVVRVGSDYDTLRNSTLSSGTLQFSDVIDMSYCGQNVEVYAFVKCGNTTVESEHQTFTVRGITLNIIASAPTWTTGDADIELTAVNAFHISTQSLVDELGTDPSVEELIAYAQAHQSLYGEYLNYLTDLQYTWVFPAEDEYASVTHNTNVENAAPTGATAGQSVNYTATFSVTMFGATCTVSKTIQIQRN